MRRIMGGLILMAAICGSAAVAEPLPVPAPQERFRELMQQLAAAEGLPDEAVAPPTLELFQLLHQAYGRELHPLPADETAPRHGLYNGLAMPPLADDRRAVGGVAARPFARALTEVLPTLVEGNWSKIFHRNFSSFERTMAEGTPADFLAGKSQRLVTHNKVENLAGWGIVFAYQSRSLFRRLKHPGLPGGEALLYWEVMDGRAKRKRGFPGVYLKRLSIFEIYLPLDQTRHLAAVTSWANAGATIFFFKSRAESSDVYNGIVKDFLDWQELLAKVPTVTATAAAAEGKSSQ